ncbi:MAG TPA: hypothetical protein VNC50_17420, partial [Planctomycetia bacterium]|nr:hypothetical protein [Planctomycetia bacterium]
WALDEPRLRSQVTVVEIAAPPEKVWPHVVAVAELPPPTEWIFRIGIAYPIRAVIEGKGPGAIRRCVFSTGEFIEPIEVWDEPNVLGFSVASNPPPLEEWSPYAHLEPPHLHGYLVSERGEFRLEAIPGGTRLTGTTWYRNRMWPSDYWGLLSDRIIGAIHHRVLRHVAALAEAPPTAPVP